MDNGPFSCSSGICLINNGRRVSGTGGSSVCSRGEMRLRAIFWGIKINEKERERERKWDLLTYIECSNITTGPEQCQ